MAFSTIGQSSDVFHRMIAFRDRYGARSVFYKSLDVVLHKALRTSVYTVVWLDVQSLADMAPPDPQFTFRFLTADEIATYAEDPTYYLDLALADRVRSGRDLCFAALAGDRLAAFGFYSLNSVLPEDAGGVAMSYPPDVAYMCFGFTHPEFRGARLHGLLMGLALQELATRGVTKLVSMVAWTNWASLKSCYRLGYVDLGKLVVVGSRRRTVGVYPKAAKQLGVGFGRKAAKPGG